MSRRTGLLVAALALLALGVGLATWPTGDRAEDDTEGHTGGGTAEPPALAVGALALRPGDAAATDLAAFGLVILNAWEHRRIPAIKERNPEATVVVYKDMASTRSYATSDGVDDPLLPTGVGYADASSRHPDWFLRDERGREIEWAGYSGHWWMDVGNPAYRAAWIGNVADEVARNGWDGVFVDNAMLSTSIYRPDGVSIAGYDDAAYARATEEFLAAAAERLRGAGSRVLVNIGGQTPPLDVVRRWATITGGVVREHFARAGSDGRGPLLAGADWDAQFDQQQAVNAAGAFYGAITYAPPDDDRTLAYARASFLLGWDGTDDALLVVAPDPGVDPRSRSWTVDVGQPTGPVMAVGPARVRAFTSGVVAVNPSTREVTIDLGSHLPLLGAPRSIELGPATGVVLGAATSAPRGPHPAG